MSWYDMTSTDERSDPPDEKSEPALPTSVETTETYEIDNGVVFYDARNPLAWVETSHAVCLTEQV